MTQIRKKQEEQLGLFWWHVVAIFSLLIGIICLFIYFYDEEPVPDPWYVKYIEDAINDRVNPKPKPQPVIPADTSDEDTETQDDSVNNTEGYYYAFLTDEEKELYHQVYDAVRQINQSVNFTNSISTESLDHIMTAFAYDHPEFYWASNYVYYLDGNQMVKNIEYELNGDEEQTLQRIYDTADAIIADMPRTSQYDSYKYIYQYLTDNTRYDLDAPVDNQQVTSVLFDHISVCAGYSKTFQLLCQRAGLESVYVTGFVPETDEYGDTHAWNLIKLNDNYYWSDVTWGDPIVPENEENIQTLFYFCTSDRYFLRNHTPAENLGSYDSFKPTYPECTDPSFEYCVLNGTYFETYDREAVKNRIQSLASEGRKIIDLQFSSTDEAKAADSDLFTEFSIYPYLDEIGVSYDGILAGVDEALSILSIYLP